MSSITEGSMPFSGGFTWYRITTPDASNIGALPLLVLHGGPGMAHDYVRNIADLADQTGRTVIHYDQFGCGRSTHRPNAPADFWTPELFVDEFFSLIGHLELSRYHVLGQSWGGMLGAEIAVRNPTDLASLSICNSPASMELWVAAAAALRAQLPIATRVALDLHERLGTLDDPEYLEATEVFYGKHVCNTDSTPQDFLDSEAQMLVEPTVYHTMNGPNEFHVIGTLREWSIIDRLGHITAPTLVLAGQFDEAAPSTWAPFVDAIADVRPVVVAGASHCTHLEYPEEFRTIIAEFLHEHEGSK